MTKLISSLLLVTFLLSPAANAWTALGGGANSCGDWVTGRKNGDWYSTGHWILGYVGAINDQDVYDLKDVNAQSIAVWVDNYCQKNPLEDIVAAARALVHDLRTDKND